MSHPLDGQAYLSLESYKKDGSGVRTPVWFAQGTHEGAPVTFVVTAGESWKVKRIRRNPAVKVAACNASGKTILGPWLSGTCSFVEPGPNWDGAHRALVEKYGWQMRLLDLGARISGRIHRRAMLAIRLVP